MLNTMWYLYKLTNLAWHTNRSNVVYSVLYIVTLLSIALPNSKNRILSHFHFVYLAIQTYKYKQALSILY
jgi:hypothetical protein